MKIGNRLIFVSALLCIAAPAELRASADTPLPTATAFAYSISHTVRPLPDSVIEQTADPYADAMESDDPDSFESHEKPVDMRAGAPRPMSRDGLCSAVALVARANNLPVPFFANLIWQESNFNIKTISRAGALGIAQFMPKTASEFGLINPFEPIHALNVAGKFVRELYDQFGNLGLAAAAYNAGPRRVLAWMAKRGDLPGETRAYVLKITGRAADDWTSPQIQNDIEATLLPAKAPCVEVADAVKAQAKTVRMARLMMEIAAAATQARDKADDPKNASKIASDESTIADAGWRARALGMVNVMLLRLSEKKKATSRLAARSIKRAFKVASRELDKAADRPAPGTDKSSIRLLSANAAKALGKGIVKVADKTPEKPEAKTDGRDVTKPEVGKTATIKPPAQRRRVSRVTRYAYSIGRGAY